MAFVLFEDDAVDRLAPITWGRPAYAIHCGAMQLVDLLPDSGRAVGLVRPHLRELQAAEFPRLEAANDRQLDDVNIWINARLVPSAATATQLSRLSACGPPRALWVDGRLAMAALARSLHGPLDMQDPVAVAQRVEAAARDAGGAAGDTAAGNVNSAGGQAAGATSDSGLALLNWPHEVVAHHLRILADSIQWRLERGEYHELADGVFGAPGASLSSHVATDTRHGPILIEGQAHVGPFSVLNGPIYIGAGATINPHAVLRQGVYAGPVTKLGGEVEASVVEGYSNKQHHGFLGHSYLGSWVNLGAGTCNSNLKNTYGTIAIDYPHKRCESGMQFFGCIIGDYTKTAINTSIFTGKLLGCCSMIYGWVTGNVPSFTNYARSFGQMTELAPGVLADTQKRMFRRRAVEQQEYHVRLLQSMYQLSQDERRLASRPLTF